MALKKDGTESGSGKIGGNPHPGNQFSKDYQPDPSKVGRKKSKIKEFAKESDLSAADVKNLIKMVFDKTEAELMAIGKDKTQPMLLRAFVKAFADDVKYGKLNNINSLLDRAGFKVADKKEISGNLGIAGIELSEEDNEKFKKNLSSVFPNLEE